MKDKSTSLREQLFQIVLVAVFGGLLGHLHGRYSTKPTNMDEPNFATSTSMNMVTSSRFHPTPTTSPALENKIGYQKDASTIVPGWRDILVYAGDVGRHLQSTPHKRRERKRNQRLEKLVLGLLRNKQGGTFLDLAAGDAIDQSSTLGLELTAQWTGWCIEPNPVYWYGLSYYRNCTLIAAVVGDSRRQRNDPIEFRYSNYQKAFFGGGVSKRFDKRNKEEATSDRKLQFTVPLVEVLQVHQIPRAVDYLSINVEGAEESIFQNIPWSEYTFSIVSLPRPTLGILHDGLSRAGYSMLLKNMTSDGGSIWAYDSVMSQLDLTVLSNLK